MEISHKQQTDTLKIAHNKMTQNSSWGLKNLIFSKNLPWEPEKLSLVVDPFCL